jgi:lipoprotein-releasing system permease protein
MLYAIKIATRYLLSSKAQTALLVFGVALGVFIFIFMSALIGGLAEYILDNTVGDISHVTIQAEAEDPAVLVAPAAGTVLAAVEKANARQAVLRDAEAFIPLIEALPEVIAVSPQINGAGFMTRGSLVSQVSINGIEPGKESVIIGLQGYLTSGSVRLGTGLVVIGKRLAEDLSLSVGNTIRLDASTGANTVLTVAGIYEIGQGGFDRATAYVSLATARTLFRLPQGVTRVEIKLTDIYASDAVALRISALTGLDAKSWTEEGQQLLDALQAQAQTGLILKSFAMVTIVIGVASSLLLSTYRRRPEIGIMRAMGASRVFVVFVFVSQGALVGILGALVGAGIGYLALLGFPARDALKPGSLPIDIGQGAFGLAILLTSLVSVLAAILPARSAARLDPVTAIGQ